MELLKFKGRSSNIAPNHQYLPASNPFEQLGGGHRFFAENHAILVIADLLFSVRNTICSDPGQQIFDISIREHRMPTDLTMFLAKLRMPF